MKSRSIALWVVAAIISLTAACALKPLQSTLIGDCKELLLPQRVWEGREEAFVGRVLLTAIDRDKVFWSRKKVVGVVDAGTRVRVAHILSDWIGSDGHFLRVQVEILDGPFRGWIAEVPSIAPYHPEPSWIVERTLDPNALRFNSQIVKDCNA